MMKTKKLPPIGVILIIILLVVVSLFFIQLMAAQKLPLLPGLIFTAINIVLAIGLFYLNNIARLGAIVLLLFNIGVDVIYVMIMNNDYHISVFTRLIGALIIIYYLNRKKVVKLFHK